MLSETGPPGLPAMVARLIPLVTLVLHVGLVPEEREQRSAGFLRVQSSHGLAPVPVLALGWHMLVMWAVARRHQVAEDAKRREAKSDLLPVLTNTCA
jgi:ABC-2 type transport system permease protein